MMRLSATHLYLSLLFGIRIIDVNKQMFILVFTWPLYFYDRLFLTRKNSQEYERTKERKRIVPRHAELMTQTARRQKERMEEKKISMSLDYDW